MLGTFFCIQGVVQYCLVPLRCSLNHTAYSVENLLLICAGSIRVFQHPEHYTTRVLSLQGRPTKRLPLLLVTNMFEVLLYGGNGEHRISPKRSEAQDGRMPNSGLRLRVPTRLCSVGTEKSGFAQAVSFPLASARGHIFNKLVCNENCSAL